MGGNSEPPVPPRNFCPHIVGSIQIKKKNRYIYEDGYFHSVLTRGGTQVLKVVGELRRRRFGGGRGT